MEMAGETEISADDVQGMLAAIAPIVGSARVASAAGKMVRALGIELALADLDDRRLKPHFHWSEVDALGRSPDPYLQHRPYFSTDGNALQILGFGPLSSSAKGQALIPCEGVSLGTDPPPHRNGS